jgi:hypothetical protein
MYQGRIQDIKLGRGAHLKKWRRAKIYKHTEENGQVHHIKKAKEISEFIAELFGLYINTKFT